MKVLSESLMSMLVKRRTTGNLCAYAIASSDYFIRAEKMCRQEYKSFPNWERLRFGTCLIILLWSWTLESCLLRRWDNELSNCPRSQRARDTNLSSFSTVRCSVHFHFQFACSREGSPQLGAIFQGPIQQVSDYCGKLMRIFHREKKWKNCVWHLTFEE